MERLLTLYSEVQSTDVRWLWYPFIAIGKITLLQGDPGDGKSTMMMNLIAELSTGGHWAHSIPLHTHGHSVEILVVRTIAVSR